MKLFKLNNQYSITCESKGTRNGFKHTANLCRGSYSVYETKICYLNRTWERFEYESVLLKVVEDYFSKEEGQKYLDIIKTMN